MMGLSCRKRDPGTLAQRHRNIEPGGRRGIARVWVGGGSHRGRFGADPGSRRGPGGVAPGLARGLAQAPARRKMDRALARTKSADSPPAMTDIRTGDWADRYAPPSLVPYIRLARLDRPIGTWLLLLPG